jgi:AcrR family transcriptional regulator
VEDDALLDAAQACVLAVGVRRTTMTDVARQADVSRMTLYRRFPDVTSLMQALMTREFTAIVDDLEPHDAAPGDARAQLVAGAVEGVERLTRHPLFLRVLDVDPELLLPYLTKRLGGFQRAVVAAFEQRVAEGAADGSIAVSDPAAAARTLELALRGFVFQPGAGDPAELRRLLDRYLAP